uniref:NADH-ubiquinone oxidoreductase chain 2 n=1 Tax=Polyacanthonotus rissoanus TaxID=391225 RepID=A0A347ZJP2_9TELE|nr:NADH dehydrogenase subunit 2 [Polyacanthonotus rissoanus]BBA85457.1 NADH dehydrogenase subunit 2 [Polyacanthonotus rissoanus]
MAPYVLSILMFSMGLGTMLTFASSHWFMAWMGLEINTLAIIPLMAKSHHPRATEATTKYFIIQAGAAALILFASATNAWMTGEWDIKQLTDPLATNMVMLALALKLGLAPLHLWMPEVLQGMTLTTGLIIATWQKLAPMALVYQIAPMVSPTLLVALGVASALVGGWGGIDQTQLRKLLAYSSITHMGWMIIVLKFMPGLMLLNLLIYILMTSTVFVALKELSATKINALALAWTKAPTLTALLMLAILSLAGLPPLTGFMPKWLILQELANQDLPLVATLMAMTALLSLFFYTRMCYAMTLTISPGTNSSYTTWRLYKARKHLPLALITTGTLTLLPLTPAMTTML